MLPSAGPGTEPKVLRVCADPDNLPYSNEKLEGFENKIAALVIQDVGAQAQLYLVAAPARIDSPDAESGPVRCPHRRSQRVRSGAVDEPYYRTTYVIAPDKERGLQIASLDDPSLTQLKIGVHVNTPPHDALTQHGIVGEMS